MNARSLTEALGGRWHGSYGTARCPAHDDRNPSLSVRDGDNGRVLVHCHAGCEQAVVLDALRSRGLWHDGDGEPHRRHRIQRDRSRPREPDPEELQRVEMAIAIWKTSKPAPGTLVETYLKNRAIAIEPPSSIRYHPSLKHGPTGLHLPVT